ncbi:hypothetical protein L914_03745 [Phytophthora nicotianae]|uniref:Uncharacterized protein n=1 Tax=Phytophthora nicotianae TaxID=4792 RepID=W2NVZ7_PHYNI|nr:hypothetical protein L914_03745 [Phytophthora nicotianae]
MKQEKDGRQSVTSIELFWNVSKRRQLSAEN